VIGFIPAETFEEAELIRLNLRETFDKCINITIVGTPSVRSPQLATQLHSEEE